MADDKVISQQEVALLQAELSEAQAKAQLAKAKLDFAGITPQFDGIVDRQREQLGSLVKEGDVLTTLSDNSVIWVYFDVPEADYLEYMESTKQSKDEQWIELELANHRKFPQPSKIRVPSRRNSATGDREPRVPRRFPKNPRSPPSCATVEPAPCG